MSNERQAITCKVLRLLSSVCIQARRVSSVMKISAALLNNTGASALIIFTSSSSFIILFIRARGSSCCRRSFCAKYGSQILDGNYCSMYVTNISHFSYDIQSFRFSTSRLNVLLHVLLQHLRCELYQYTSTLPRFDIKALSHHVPIGNTYDTKLLLLKYQY